MLNSLDTKLIYRYQGYTWDSWWPTQDDAEKRVRFVESVSVRLVESVSVRLVESVSVRLTAMIRPMGGGFAVYWRTREQQEIEGRSA